MKNLNSSSNQVLLEKALFFYQTHQFEKAKVIYKQLIKAFPKNYIALTNLGSIELQLGNFNTGIDYLQKSIELNKDQPSAINNLANGLYEIGRFDEALVKIKEIEQLDFVDAHYNKGRILNALNRFDDAIKAYDYVLKISSNYILALINRGLIFHKLKKYEEALKDYEKVIQINPEYSGAYYNLGLTYVELKNYEMALKAYEDAIQINPTYKEAYCNLGILYNTHNEKEKALQSLKNAIQIDPNYAEAYYNCGVIHEDLKEYNEASKAYKNAIQINPNYAEAFVNLALIELNQKNFKEGWRNFEKRFLLDLYKIKNINLNFKEVNLNSIKISKRVLIINEQGIGDEILYIGMLSSLIACIPNIDVLVDSRLIKLLKRSFPEINFIASASNIELSQYDAVIPMGNLGKIFRNSIEDFGKWPVPYLKADLSKLNLNRVEPKKICGISWKSKNERIGENKSINLELLLPILKLPHLDFVCLQYGEVEDEIKHIESVYKIRIKKVEDIDIFNDIDGLASIISKMDFVITASNINAHLAGALGKETYLLVPYSKGKIWYWHEEDKQSIWYPSVAIYRQSRAKSWQEPIAEIIANLKGNLID